PISKNFYPASGLSCRGFLADLLILYSMKIKEQTRKLAAGCSKHCFEVADRTDEVSNIYTARRR
ncbi:hypothetical protein, partial [Lentilactobacillus parakefiri]